MEERIKYNITENKNLKSIYNCGDNNTIQNCDFSKKTSIKNYYTIINLAKSLYDNDSGPGLAYDRNILGALLLKTPGYLENLLGYIQNIRLDEEREYSTVYLGNVFKDDLYISNHLVCRIKNSVIRDYQLEVGMFIRFSGIINKYWQNGVKFGICDVTVNEIIFDEYKSNIDKLNDFDWKKFNFKQEYPSSPKYGNFKYMKYLFSRITNITTRLSKSVPTEFYINMLLSMHLTDRIEKYMLVFQGNHDYLIDNCDNLLLPLSTIIFALEELKIYDPFTILSLLTHVYACTMGNRLKSIAKTNDMDPCSLNVYIKRNFENTSRVCNLKSYFDIEGHLLDYFEKLINEYNEILIE